MLVDKTREESPKFLTDFDKFVDVLRRSGQEVVIDGDLTSSERSKIDAFACYLTQHLYPAVLHTMWVDDLNYTTVTQYWYSNRLPFPYNLYYLEKRRKRAQRHLQNQSVNRIMQNALQALNMLSAKLGDNKYMCGNKPSSLDALVFGYLAPLLRLPMPNDRLQLHLSACPNLVRFVESIISIYLPLSEDQLRSQRANSRIWKQRLQKAEKSKEAEKAAATANAEQVQEDLPLRDSILFAIGAVTLSVLFALHTGIVQVVVDDDEAAIEEST